MQISLNIKDESISKKILDFLASFQKEDIGIKTFDNAKDTQESISSFSGMWKDRDVDITTIRASAWKK